jgi:hypothetical protein
MSKLSARNCPQNGPGARDRLQVLPVLTRRFWRILEIVGKLKLQKLMDVPWNSSPAQLTAQTGVPVESSATRREEAEN